MKQLDLEYEGEEVLGAVDVADLVFSGLLLFLALSLEHHSLREVYEVVLLLGVVRKQQEASDGLVRSLLQFANALSPLELFVEASVIVIKYDEVIHGHDEERVHQKSPEG